MVLVLACGYCLLLNSGLNRFKLLVAKVFQITSSHKFMVAGYVCITIML